MPYMPYKHLYILSNVGYNNNGEGFMSYIAAMIERETEKMALLLGLYEQQIGALPKGSLRVRERNGKSYYYLAYRKEGKVVTDYIGNDETALNGLKEQLGRRQDIERLRKAIKRELRLMNKAMEAAK
jgi:hypothetical protein